jgi:hypothetical protein
MKKIIVIDNFLEEEDCKKIKDVFYNKNFPWYFNNYKSYSKDYIEEDKNLLCDELSDFQFTHTFFNDFERKSGWDISPIVNKLNPSALIRIKANLTTKTETQKVYGFHCDVDDKCFTAIYYLNTNNGKTIFEDGSEINSSKNRVVIFDSQIRHTGTSCTDKNTRMLINFNYY